MDPADPDGRYSPVGYRDFLRQQEGLLTQAPKLAPGGGPPDPGGDPPDSGKGSSDKKIPDADNKDSKNKSNSVPPGSASSGNGGNGPPNQNSSHPKPTIVYVKCKNDDSDNSAEEYEPPQTDNHQNNANFIACVPTNIPKLRRGGRISIESWFYQGEFHLELSKTPSGLWIK